MDSLKAFWRWSFHYWTTITGLLSQFCVFIYGLLLRFLRAVGDKSQQILHGPEEERKRVVVKAVKLPTPSVRSSQLVYRLAKTLAVMRHCSVHIIPIFTTIILGYLNFVGYFIGENFTGSTAGLAQDIDRLSIQVAAKIFELFIIASLGVVILDAVRDKMLYGSEGVPLGLVAAPFSFGDINFLLSHEFRAGSRGFGRKRTSWMFGILIISCALIAVFVGPSSALLLIPAYFESWPGGGAWMTLLGDLQPAILDVSPTWDPRCTSVGHNMTLLNHSDGSLGSCPWAGFPYLSDGLVEAVFVQAPLYYNDSITARQIRNWAGSSDDPINSVRMSSVGTNIAAGAVARALGTLWCEAMFNAPQVGSGRLLENFRDRTRNGSKGSLESPLPHVRTQCFNASNYVDLLKDRGFDMNRTLPFPVITDLPTPPGAAYLIPFNTSQSPILSTQWIPIPSRPSNTTYGVTTSNYPSAFLVIQNVGHPILDPIITCSIKAAWIPGVLINNAICWGPDFMYGVFKDNDWSHVLDWATTRNTPASGIPDFQGFPNWKPVSLTIDWLNVLTPPISQNATNYTTLASVLDTLGQRYYQVEGIRRIYIAINTVIASFITDGMSRVAYNENKIAELNQNTICTKVDAPPNPGNNQGGQQPCLWQTSGDTILKLLDGLVLGKAEMEPYPLTSSKIRNRIKYYVTIAGLGIKATSMAYYLGLAVLFAYICIAFGHIAWTASHGRISDNWRSLTDLLVLSQTSLAPVKVLEDTSTGVESHKTLKTQVRIRNNAAVAEGQETLQLYFGENSEGINLEEVLDNVEYGAKS